jgi:putative transposase
VVGQPVLTVVVTNKVFVPHSLTPILDSLLPKCQVEVKKMLEDRSKNSSKYYPDLPCVVSKSLISKYQKNSKCRSVKRLAIQICGDKGKQVKLDPNNKLRVPALFKKETISIFPLRPILGHVRSIEFFKKNKTWFMSYTYNTPANPEIKITGFVGVDRNVRGNIATLSDPETGKVLRLGPDIKPWKDNFKNRKANLQRKGVTELLKKINRKQSNLTKDINHKVSKKIVAYAVKHCKAIVLEDLGKIKDSKSCGRFVKKSNWSFYQLETFIKYKATLNGIPVLYVNPRNTSKGCSRCGYINSVSGKAFKCNNCGHKDHRDANAGFNIANLAGNLGNGLAGNERELPVGFIDDPQTSKGGQ